MMQGKAFSVGHILYYNLWAAPALLQGLVPVQGSGLGVLKQDLGREIPLPVHSSCYFFRSVLRVWKKRLVFDADCCSCQWLFSLFQPSPVRFLCYQTFLSLLSEAPLNTLTQLFISILIFNLHLSAEMPGANCFSWTAAHELTYNLIQVQSLKGSAAPLSWVHCTM